MKKSLFAISMVLAALISFSCGNEKKEVNAGDQSVTTQKDESGREKQVVLVPSVLFYDEGSLWFENKAGELERYATLTAGQTLYAYPAAEGSESEVANIQKKKKAGQTNEDNYLQVRYDNKDYWVLSDLVIPNATAKVVLEDTINYTKDDIDGVSSVKVPAGKIVAVHNDYSSKEDADIKFYKVTWRKGSERSYRNVYIKADCISERPDDVIALRLLNKLKNLKNEVVIDEIYSVINKLNVSPNLVD